MLYLQYVPETACPRGVPYVILSALPLHHHMCRRVRDVFNAAVGGINVEQDEQVRSLHANMSLLLKEWPDAHAEVCHSYHRILVLMSACNMLPLGAWFKIELLIYHSFSRYAKASLLTCMHLMPLEL